MNGDNLDFFLENHQRMVQGMDIGTLEFHMRELLDSVKNNARLVLDNAEYSQMSYETILRRVRQLEFCLSDYKRRLR